MSESPCLQASHRVDGRTVVALPEHALADRNLDQTRAQLVQLGDGVLNEELHIDLGRVGALNSAALGMLVGLHRRLDDAGGCLVICNLAPHLRDLVRLTRLDTILHVRPLMQ